MQDSDWVALPKSWKEAKQNGSQFYYTGKPCRHGHVARRYASGGGCEECSKNWWRKNIDRFKEIQARSYQKHREKRLAAHRERRQKNKEEIREYQANNRKRMNENSNRWYWRHRELVAERYQTVYREKAREHHRNRKARLKNADGHHTANDVMEIFKMQHGKCACCAIKLQDYHVDHIQPLARGGTNDRRNLQILCGPCNIRKHAKDPIDFMRERGKLL